MHTASQIVSKFPAMTYTGVSSMNANALEKGYEILGAVSGASKISHVWGYDPNASNTEHHSGRALDLMVYNDRALGDRIAAYLITNAKRLGINWIIWRQRIWYGYGPEVNNTHNHQWVPMADRGNSTNNHMDHVHVYFDTSSYRAPNVVTRAKVAVKRGPSTVLGSRQLYYREPVMTGSDVKFVQRFLGITQDGKFGPATRAAVIRYQRMRGIKVDGYVGPVTWRNMLGR